MFHCLGQSFSPSNFQNFNNNHCPLCNNTVQSKNRLYRKYQNYNNNKYMLRAHDQLSSLSLFYHTALIHTNIFFTQSHFLFTMLQLYRLFRKHTPVLSINTKPKHPETTPPILGKIDASQEPNSHESERAGI